MGNGAGGAGGNRRVLCTLFDAFAVAVERRCNPRLAHRPVVIDGGGESRGLVVVCSTESRAAGIRPAMPVARAQHLCRDVAVVPWNGELYGRASQAVCTHLARYSPNLEREALDTVAMDITGTTKLLGTPPELARRARHEIARQFGLQATCGVAANRLVARIAAHVAGEDGVCAVGDGEEERFLAPLAIEMLPGVGAATRRRLADFNMRTIGDLAAGGLPLLLGAFGHAGRRLYDNARGVDSLPHTSLTLPMRSLTGEVHPPGNGDDPDAWRVAVRVAIETLAHRLRTAGILAGCMTIHVTHADGVSADTSAALPVASDLDDDLLVAALPLVTEALERRVHVRRLTLGLSGLAAASPQVTLFPPGCRREQRRALARAVDRIRERHGVAAITVGTVFGNLPRGSHRVRSAA
jgi:DNA polymerase-4